MAIKTLTIVCCFFIMFSYCGNIYASVEVENLPPEVKRERPLEYAWASCHALGEECFVIIWIRGVREDTRITIKGPVKKDHCYVEIPSKTFDKYFRYAALAGLNSNSAGPIMAMFGGGPAGGREIYWFEWSLNVKPSFYCILR